MADYRFSAASISRGKGQSSVASAAYRSASRLIDERTGEIHDYTRKSGVTHSEVMMPEATPEWMQDRAQLWNAVEAVETRKNSQLAREIQLSLPHELTPDQRKELVRDFVQEQFVNQGMIADINIHAPDKNGDERNHHAHIMLTMRELTGEGFHQKKATEKARSWNSDEQLLQWREQWASHQNRALERHGHSARVDHRSFEAQGIDREPSHHLGAVASDMERNGKRSRIGEENRVIANDNAARAKDHMELAQVAREKWKFGQWADFKRSEIENAQDLAGLDLSQKHHRQKSRLDGQLREMNHTAKATIRAEVDAVDRRLSAVGVRKVLRDVFGRTKTDSTTRGQLQATLTNIEKREKEARGALERRQMVERQKEARRQNKNRDRLEKGIRTARGRREGDDWKPRSPQRGTKRTGRPERKKTAKPATSPLKKQEKASTASPERIKSTIKGKDMPEVRQSDAPDMADQKTTITSKLDEKRGDLKRPWERSSLSNENERPWENDLFKPERGRTRSLSPSPSGNGGGKGGKS